MWESIKVGLYYVLSIGVIIIVVALIVFSFIALFNILLHMFKQTPRTVNGVVSSGCLGCLSLSVFGILAIAGLGLSVYLLDFTEDADYENRLDKQYEKMSETELINEDHLLVILNKVGRFGGGRRSTLPRIDFYIKNYHDADYKGSVTIHIMLDGESIANKEFELDLDSEGFFSKVISPSDIDIGNYKWRKIWGKINVDYSIDGEFKK